MQIFTHNLQKKSWFVLSFQKSVRFNMFSFQKLVPNPHYHTVFSHSHMLIIMQKNVMKALKSQQPQS